MRLICATGPLVGIYAVRLRLWRVATCAATAREVGPRNLYPLTARIPRLNTRAFKYYMQCTRECDYYCTSIYHIRIILYCAYATCCPEDPAGNTTDPNDWDFIGRPRAPLQPLDQKQPRAAIIRRRRRRQSCIERASVAVYNNMIYAVRGSEAAVVCFSLSLYIYRTHVT